MSLHPPQFKHFLFPLRFFFSWISSSSAADRPPLDHRFPPHYLLCSLISSQLYHMHKRVGFPFSWHIRLSSLYLDKGPAMWDMMVLILVQGTSCVLMTLFWNNWHCSSLVYNKFSTCVLWINSIVISLCVCHIQTGVKGWNSGKSTPFVFQ